MKIIAIVVCTLASVTAGCDRIGAPGDSAAATNKQPQIQQRSAAKDVIYTMTQYDTISTGKRVQEKVKAITATHNKDLNEAATAEP